MQLFDFDSEPITVLDNDGKITYWDHFLEQDDATILFNELLENSTWKEESITLFAKRYKQPRLTSWYGVYGVLADGQYQVITEATAFTPRLFALKNKIEKETSSRFNCVLVNLYRDENDSVGYHADDEAVLGKSAVIASYSLGETRRFLVKHNEKKFNSIKIGLKHNSLLLMGAGLQDNWKHAIPKTKRPMGVRINLTFRFIYK